MQHKTIYLDEAKQITIDEQDDKLLQLQEHITDKISRESDENLIKLYLHQISKLASERLQLRRNVRYETN